MLRRPPLQAEWLETVVSNPMALEEAPMQVRRDKEVILLAAKSTYRALEFATPELWEDIGFVKAAVAMNWRVWLQYVHPALRDRRDVVITVLKTHGRALRHVPKELCKDPEVILAAMHTRPPELALGRFSVSGTLEALMKEHVEFVFRHATLSLRHDRDFLIKMMHKDWLCADYAAPELWADKTFAVEAVRLNCDLLKRVAAPLRCDTALIRAAMAQADTSMEQVARELYGASES
eukprot:TRINITY_DN11093_c0_g1_i2.p1 TRINITY_DN11093_c0_g1~~TRINITY_DN11093_c0_g1_i2.p1  ORF type:complete len:235 (-),score=54.81 TRINITY_DN11093_c0_g1_i2:44-748(-)